MSERQPSQEEEHLKQLWLLLNEALKSLEGIENILKEIATDREDTEKIKLEMLSLTTLLKTNFSAIIKSFRTAFDLLIKIAPTSLSDKLVISEGEIKENIDSLNFIITFIYQTYQTLINLAKEARLDELAKEITRAEFLNVDLKNKFIEILIVFKNFIFGANFLLQSISQKSLEIINILRDILNSSDKVS